VQPKRPVMDKRKISSHGFRRDRNVPTATMINEYLSIYSIRIYLTTYPDRRSRLFLLEVSF